MEFSEMVKHAGHLDCFIITASSLENTVGEEFFFIQELSNNGFFKTMIKGKPEDYSDNPVEHDYWNDASVQPVSLYGYIPTANYALNRVLKLSVVDGGRA